jgi:perosamine synthetase
MGRFEEIVKFIRDLYQQDDGFIPLHAPVFWGNEKAYLANCIDSTFVSYIGEYVTKFEDFTANYTGSNFAVALVNGTTALQVALSSCGVEQGDEVITQALTFVATANAISHNSSYPVFIDIDKDNLGMSPEKLSEWLKANSKYDKSSKKLINKETGRPISAVVPVHIFGHPCRIDEIVKIAEQYHLKVIEDSAESLGSFYKNQHTGTFGNVGILSFNGNKTITTGGGGMIITNDEELAKRVKHITTTAKIPHPYEFIHDKIAYNYRMPNVNAAIGLAQMEKIDTYLQDKKETAKSYDNFFSKRGYRLFKEPKNATSNYWLNAILLHDLSERNEFLEYTNKNGVMTRPCWRLMNKLEMFKSCSYGDLTNSEFIEQRLVNIPSGVKSWKQKSKQ